MAGSASASSLAFLTVLLSAFIVLLLAAPSPLLTATDEDVKDGVAQSLELFLNERVPSTVRERCYQSFEGRTERFLKEDGVTPVTFADCERSPPCIKLSFMHEEDDAKDYKHCATRPNPTDWPTWDPYEDSMDVDDTLGGSPDPMALLAELIGNKTVIMVGDSIMFQTFYSLMCGLVRAGENAAPGSDKRVAWLRTTLAERGASFTKGVAAPRFGTLFLFARVNYYLEDVLARFLDLADIAIVNYGLHYTSLEVERFANDVISLQNQLEQFVETPGKIAVIRGMSAQHFPHSGAWNLSDPTHQSNCTCARMEPRIAETNYVAMQDRILQEAVVRASSPERLLFLPLYDLTVQRHDMHLQACKSRGNQSDYAWSGCCDCTHYCYTPGLWDRFAARLLNLFWRGHCHMKSGDCTDASSSPLSSEALRDHFQERQVLAHLHDMRYG